MRDICPNCEKETRLELINRDEEIIVRGEPIIVTLEYYKCTECNTEFRDPHAQNDPLDTAYREYRKRHGIIQPEKIADFRKHYGLTQHEFASLLGWGAATLSRYENGALQDDAHDTALKLAMEPENLIELIETKPETLSSDKREKLVKVLREVLEERESSFRAIYESKFDVYGASEASGYKRLNIAKLFNAIIFFCKDKEVPKTKLNKLLFYADFMHYKEYAVSITGARYAHLPYGPVPDNYQYYIAALHHEEGAIDIQERTYNDFTGEFLSSLKEPDLSLFSTTELRILAAVEERFADFTSTKISAFSHEEEGYKRTSDGGLISYYHASSINI